MTSWDSSDRSSLHREPPLVFDSDGGLPEVDTKPRWGMKQTRISAHDLVVGVDGALYLIDQPHDCQHERWFSLGVISTLVADVLAYLLVKVLI